jgi:hypothetical protein
VFPHHRPERGEENGAAMKKFRSAVRMGWAAFVMWVKMRNEMGRQR